MKCISIHQPLASLIANGIKKLESRSRRTSYRGQILIASTLKIDQLAIAYLKRISFSCKTRMEAGIIVEDRDKYEKACNILDVIYGDLPLGCIVAMADLVDCREATEDDVDGACCQLNSGMFVYELKDVRETENIKIKGKQGIYNIELEEKDLFQGGKL